MHTRFNVDLLHPGWGVRSWYDWFIDPRAPRRLAMFTLGCVAVLLVVLAGVILPARLRLSATVNALPGLRRDLETRQDDLTVLRANLGGLTQEAKRQVRWADVLTVLSQQIPATLKLEVVDAARAALPGAPHQPGGPPPATESLLRISSVTPLRPGSQPLMDVAQFMAGLMREPTVNKRFQVKSWEIKPGRAPAQGGVQLLDVSIVLTERAQ